MKIASQYEMPRTIFCFAANSIVCRMALVPKFIDAETFTTIRVLSAGAMLSAGWRLCQYGVFTGEEALALFMEANVTYKALVTDVRLGDGLDGWEVARRVREKEPSLPVIYVSGSTAEEWVSYGVPNSILISKPFAPAQLVTALSNLLNIGSANTICRAGCRDGPA